MAAALALLTPDPVSSNTVAREMRDDIREIIATIECWEEDKRCNLTPTDGSLARAKVKAQMILRRLG